jgi:hypothetical protein
MQFLKAFGKDIPTPKNKSRESALLDMVHEE